MFHVVAHSSKSLSYGGLALDAGQHLEKQDIVPAYSYSYYLLRTTYLLAAPTARDINDHNAEEWASYKQLPCSQQTQRIAEE